MRQSLSRFGRGQGEGQPTSLLELTAPLARVAPWIVLAMAAVVFPLLFFVTAPYGRHFRPGWGPAISARAGWLVMEAPSFFVFGLLWLGHPLLGTPVVTTLGVLWLSHYLQRVFVFSVRMRDQGKKQPLLTISMAIVFNLLNVFGNAWALTSRPLDVPFFLGVAMFVAGFVVNVHADETLRRLRGPGETGYKIPQGGLYRFVSSPNYLGEMMEWVGFAIAAQTLAGWAFAVFTVANLAPRARANHRWYLAKFPEYPASRRALIPYLW